jgi:hypothetical protein
LNDEAKAGFITSVLADKAVWAATLAGLAGASSGSVEWTMGGAIGVIATLGSKGFATLSQRREHLKASDYRLIYRVAR